MNKLFFKIFLIVTLYYLNITLCDEILVQINVNRPINIVSDKYVSFSIDPKIISESMGSNNSQIIDHMASQLSPAYLKISGESFFKLTTVLSNNIEINDDIKDNNPEDLLNNFNEWISSVGWKPIIPLSYEPLHWDSMEALRILNISSALGIKNCIWQLGIDFNATGATNYVADLITLQTMVGAFKNFVDDWRIIGADISAGSSPEETKLYVDLVKNIVEAVGWMPSSTQSLLITDNLQMINDKDLALKNLLNSKLPTWLSLPMKNDKYKNLDNGCSVFCVTEGLQWAQTLGDSAKIGFKVIYKSLNVNDFNEPNLNYYISLLYKRIMGEKVFDSKIIGVDKFVTRLYSHCTKDKSGGISIMGVNMAEERSKILMKYSIKSTGSELWQYIITVNNGIIMLNDEQIHLNSTLTPFIKIKHPNRPISISLPPMSIGFWILPHANHDECLTNPDNSYKTSSLSSSSHLTSTVVTSSEEQLRKNPRIRTSSDKLLQELIMKNAAAARINSASSSLSPNRRQKRHIVVKKDSNYLKQQLSHNYIPHLDAPQQKDNESFRYKRFVLKNGKSKGLENLLDVQKLFDTNYSGQLKKISGIESSINTRTKRQALPHMPLRKPGGLRGRFPLRKNMFKAVNAAAAAAAAATTAITGATPNSTTGTAAADNTDHQKTSSEEHRQQPEDRIFEKKTNMNLQNLPNGDVHFKLTRVDGDYDYVEFDENQNTSSDQNKKTKYHHDAPDDESFRTVPTAFHESYQIQKVIPRENAHHNGEIWEMVSKPDIQRLDEAEMKNFPNDQHIGYITRELEPTYNQNSAGLRQAQQQLRSYYMQQPLNSNEQQQSSFKYNTQPGSGIYKQNQQQPQRPSPHHFYNTNQEHHNQESNENDYSLNSQESLYRHNHNHHHLQAPAPIPAPQTNQKYPPITRWKRSMSCEKCLFSIKNKSSNKCKCNFKEQNDNNILRSPSHSRKRRDAVLKSISWALNNEVNVIPKEYTNNDNIYRRIYPYRMIPRNYHISMRPHNYDDIPKWIEENGLNNLNSNSNTNNHNLYNVDDNSNNNYNERTSNTEKRHIDNAKILENSIIDNTIDADMLNHNNGHGHNSDEERQPKFMRMFSEKVSSFMDMINHHVSGWWNTWA